MSLRTPTLIAFDLDYTLWDLWIDTHVTAPLRRKDDTINQVLDRYNDTVAFYRDVPHILHRLKAADIIIAVCSRTSATKLAKEALSLLLVPPSPVHIVLNKPSFSKPTPAIEFFDILEIYPGSKITHFKEIHKKLNIPYSEMLFFDDEHRNREVESLGVTFQLVSKGLTSKVFENGLSYWRSRHLEEVLDGVSSTNDTSLDAY